MLEREREKTFLGFPVMKLKPLLIIMDERERERERKGNVVLSISDVQVRDWKDDAPLPMYFLFSGAIFDLLYHVALTLT